MNGHQAVEKPLKHLWEGFVLVGIVAHRTPTSNLQAVAKQPQPKGGLLGLHCGGDVVALGHATINKLPQNESQVE
jgi:hypothetical protein